ncbi:BQ2448_4542 [Microbotryum intermedium]|uniref:triacylglycerol lipase n=1 Tax=Microbotryum intermedium TaxID=269621 RepID=A0A238FKZ1_9BASI|nr:BQ2448_4542 [Microbotryum intermedium]
MKEGIARMRGKRPSRRLRCGILGITVGVVAALIGLLGWGLCAASILCITMPLHPNFPYPDVDPFYVAPLGFEKDRLGMVYRSRKVAKLVFGHEAIQVLYRTTDALGNATTTVTTIVQTNGTASNRFLVSYSPYEDGASSRCSPSFCFNVGSAYPFCPEGATQLYPLMKRGWTILVTDYEGNNSAFTVGHQAGYQTLDGYRAAINYLGLPPDVPLGGIGFSGGAMSAGWSAALHNNYAPELNLRAIAFGGTPANVTSSLERPNRGSNAGFAMTGIAGQMAAFPELKARWDDILTSKGRSSLADITRHCAIHAVLRYGGTDILSTDFQSLGDKLLYDPIIAKYLNRSIMGLDPSETPTKPSLYMYQSVVDETTPYQSALWTARTWCSRGAKIIFVTETGKCKHACTKFAYGHAVSAWVDDQLRGKVPAVTACTFTSQAILPRPPKELKHSPELV